MVEREDIQRQFPDDEENPFVETEEKYAQALVRLYILEKTIKET
jgi:hypothetical protein